MRILTIACTAMILTACSYIDVFAAEATIRHHYKTVYSQDTVKNKVCKNVEVPIYGTVRKNKAGEGALLGAILGGVTGKVITNDDGGAAVGALFGAIVGADQGANGSQTVVTGYRTERKCNWVYEVIDRPSKVYSHSTVIFWNNGVKYRVNFQR